MRLLSLAALVLCAACSVGAGDDPALDSSATVSAAPVVAPVDTLDAPAASAPADAATPATPPGDGAWTVRFDGAGPLRVGMTLAEARRALGGDLEMRDDDGRAGEGPDRCQYPQSARLPDGVRVMVEGQRVVRVDVESAAVATAEGARVGDTEARIQQLYPGRVAVEPHKYTDGHYLVVRPAAADSTHLVIFETDGRVVERFRAGGLPQVRWVEGCS